MFFVKQGGTYDTKLGPFVDKGDGVAYETGMSAAMGHATTGVRLSKNGAAFADRAETTDPAYDAFGYYLVKLDATDTNTVGILKVIFGDAAVCLPCEANYQVIEPAVYDALFKDAATGIMPDPAGLTTLIATVGAAGVGLTSVALADATSDAVIAHAVFGADATTYQATGTFGLAIGDPASDSAGGIYKGVVTDAAGLNVAVDVVALKAETVEILTDTAVIGALGAGLTALPQLPTLALTTGTVHADAGNTAASFQTHLTEADNYWNDALILITSGALSGQVKEIGDFANTGGVITLTSGQAFTGIPADNVTFTIINR
jgi:hypothetical protein